MPQICLVTSNHISYNPRLLKEADALHGAGYDVRVVAVTTSSDKKRLDEQLMQSRSWRLDTIDVRRAVGRSGLHWLKAGLRQKLYRLHRKLQERPRGLSRAYSRYVDEVAALATAEPADLVIAHNLQALPAAHQAARQHGAKLGFDAEDFHRGEFPDDAAHAPLRELTKRIETHYIPQCDYLTAASEGIGRAYAQTLDVAMPRTILNVFPLSARKGHTPKEMLRREKSLGSLSVYWYSQKIGPDRGVQDAVRALGLLGDERVHLVLRGEWAGGFEAELTKLAERCGVARRLHALPPAPPDQLVERASQHDIGLALEQGHTPNRDICVTNKLFAYLLAGVPVVATNTAGQRTICETVPDATRLCPVGEPTALAGALRSLLRKNDAGLSAGHAARSAAEKCYNWDVEKKKLTNAVAMLLQNSVKERTRIINKAP